MEYRVIQSNRKTMSAEIKNNELIVRVPFGTTDAQIERFLNKHKDWLDKNMKKANECKEALDRMPRLTNEQIHQLANEALRVIPPRVAYYAKLIGVSYGRITVRNQKTRWGSCTAEGNLNFNCLLMLAPLEVLDSVIVHELCHRKEMNHSERFYREVLKVYPDYDKWNGWLKENGRLLLGQML